MRCANHPDAETHLRCSRCGKPICPRCVIQTPVGGRCRECANVRKAPIFQVGPTLYARAALYGLGVAAVGGLLLAQSGRFLGGIGGLLGLSTLLLLLLGYAIGEAVSRGANGRISTWLSVLAGSLTVVAVVGGRGVALVARLPSDLPLLYRAQAGMAFGVESLFGNLLGLLFVVLAVVIAVSRVR